VGVITKTLHRILAARWIGQQCMDQRKTCSRFLNVKTLKTSAGVFSMFYRWLLLLLIHIMQAPCFYGLELMNKV